MSPVTLAELDPVTRKRVLEQIPNAEGCTAFATCDNAKSDKMSGFSAPTDFSSMTDDALLDYWKNAAPVLKGAYDATRAFLSEVLSRFHAAKKRGEKFWGYSNFDRLCDERLD